MQPAVIEDNDIGEELCEAVKAAAAESRSLCLQGGGTKRFYGRDSDGKVLAVSAHSGVVAYEPTELVVTVRAGTPLSELEAVLAEQGQMLAFEPPHFGDSATLGGTVACGVSGPRRPYAGACRDFMLGTRIINGRGELLQFGGQVMKNVAGYDVSRLMVGAMGTLGIVTEVSLKVLPLPSREATVRLSLRADAAIQRMNEWAGQPLPISATCHVGDSLSVRVSGSNNGVQVAIGKLAGDLVDDEPDFWQQLKEHRHAFFDDSRPLWRISVPPAARMLSIDGEWLIEWGGAQRWLKSEADAETIRDVVAQAGGHATLFRGGDRSGPVFHPLPDALFALHSNLKKAFDPGRILNPGRLYAGL